MAKILFSGNNSDLTKYYKTGLMKYHQVVIARDGIDAYQKTIELEPDILILDYYLEKIGGLELSLLLKNEGINTPVILFASEVSTSAADQQKLTLLKTSVDVENLNKLIEALIETSS